MWNETRAVFENIDEDITKIIDTNELHELYSNLRELFEERVQQARQIGADHVGVELSSFYQ